MLQDDEQLDQLIKAINNHNNIKINDLALQSQFKSQSQIKKYLPKLQPKLKIDISSSVSKPKFLTFKPWSGTIALGEHYTTEAIHEQIENQDEESNYQGEKEDYMSQSKIAIGNMPSNNQIGYFYRFQTGKVKLIKCLLDQNGFKDCHFNNKNWTLYWSSSPFKMDVYRSLLPYQKVNHFPNSFHLTRKDLMNKTVSKMQLKYGITHYNFLPKTYILPQQLDQLLAQYNKHPQTYIVKPHNRSQGKGITVTNSLQTIYSKLQKYSSLIVSHYIGNPLLINRLKFDLRIYVAITGINPLRIYVYEQGLARFATEEYDSSGYDSENKRYQHLTNYSVNKKNQDFIASNNENQQYFGSKWSLSAMKSFLACNIGKAETAQLFDRIDEVIVKTILSAQNLLFTSCQNNVTYINSCFQVLGFDIMIDSNLKPWLIQVNHSPSMNTDSSLDLKIKGNMIADLFTMAGFTPLNDRYLDGGHSRYESRHYYKVDERKANQSAIDKFILKEVEMEYERRGDWRRVFPCIKNIKYKVYFEVDRYYNRLLRQKLIIPQQPHSSNIININNKDYNSVNNHRSNTVDKPQSQNTNKRPSIYIRMSMKNKKVERISYNKHNNTSLAY